MNKRKFTTLAAGVAAALLVSALAFTMVSCGGEFTQDDMDAEFARGQAAVKQGITDAKLISLGSGSRTLVAAVDDVNATSKAFVADGKIHFTGTAVADAVENVDYIKIGGAIGTALGLLKTGDSFTVTVTSIPGLGVKAWVSAISYALAPTPTELGKFFAATPLVATGAGLALEGTVPAGCTLSAATPSIATGKTLTVNGTLAAATSLTVTGTLAGSGLVLTEKVIGGQFDGTDNILAATSAVASKIASLIANIEADAGNTKTKAAVTIPAGVDASFKTKLTVAHALTIEPNAVLTIQAGTDVDLGTAGSIVLVNKLGTTATAAAAIKFVHASSSLVKIGTGTATVDVTNTNLLVGLNAGTAKGCTSAANVVGGAAAAGTSVLTQIIGGANNTTLNGPVSGTGNVTINASTAVTGES
ncbi:MAG: hypothetical protein Ta2G_07620 [Termitinemataceae bacterium]|nr:MAG: hypothetical protein Ta2G_07620 [Termitinemataceae bacterium]